MREQILFVLESIRTGLFGLIILGVAGFLLYVLFDCLRDGWKYLRTRAARRILTGRITALPPGMEIQSVSSGTVFIRGRVTIGTDVTISPGVTICDGATVLSDSHVTRDVPPGVTVAGNPAKPVPCLDLTAARMIS